MARRGRLRRVPTLSLFVPRLFVPTNCTAGLAFWLVLCYNHIESAWHLHHADRHQMAYDKAHTQEGRTMGTKTLWGGHIAMPSIRIGMTLDVARELLRDLNSNLDAGGHTESPGLCEAVVRFRDRLWDAIEKVEQEDSLSAIWAKGVMVPLGQVLSRSRAASKKAKSEKEAPCPAS